MKRTEIQGIKIIYQGDSTTTGGQVLQGTSLYKEYQRPVALQGHAVWCPACKSVGTISQGCSDMVVQGVGVALDSYIVSCGCPRGSHRVLAG